MPLTRKNPRDPDSPFLTREALGKGKRLSERFPGLAAERDAHNAPPETVTLSHDVVMKLQATGPEWPQLAEKILLEGLKRMKQKKAA